MACTGWYCNHNAGVEGSIERGKFCCRREWGEAAAIPAGAQDKRLCKHYAAGMQCASSPACRCLVHSSMVGPQHNPRSTQSCLSYMRRVSGTC